MTKKLDCVMVIDDDEPTNFISRMIIEEAGCTKQLEIVDSGIKALTYFERLSESFQNQIKVPDLILLDVNMPRMNGWEFLNEYKKISNCFIKKPVIIMLTTSVNPDDKQRAAETGEVAGFENKPLTNEMIERLVKTYFFT
jgi:CheY-like chemotaxis protein